MNMFFLSFNLFSDVFQVITWNFVEKKGQKLENIYQKISVTYFHLLHLWLTPCHGGEACMSQMTQRALLAGNLVPGRSDHATLVEG